MTIEKSIETSGKTVDQAIEKALEKLDTTKDEAEIEVLDEGEPGGLLGIGRKPARVLVTIRIDSEPEEADYKDYSEDDNAEETIESDDFLENSDDDDYYYNEEDYDDEPSQYVEFEESEREEPDEEGERGFAVAENAVLDYLQDILSGIGIHGRIESFVDEEGSLHIDVEGSNSGAAIGRHGETLDALQYLANVVANKYVDDYLRVVVDVADYRKRSEEKIKKLAIRTAEKVIASGREMKLKPMNPAERRLVHIALRNYPGISTYSEGRDPRRHIVVAPSAGVEFIDEKEQ